MANTLLLGAQWGDEGKGKVIDVLSRDADVIVRYQGGSNAGHTVKVNDTTYILHLIPSGIIHEGKICVIGNGVVVDPVALCRELDELAAKGVHADGRLFVSDRAQVVFPYHRAIDGCREGKDHPGRKLGTTKRGIGPCYGDKMARVGLRMADLLAADFDDLLAQRMEDADTVLRVQGGEPLDRAAIRAEYGKVRERLRPLVADTVALLTRLRGEGRSILLEGAQGTMLDIDFGTYPFVTSSNATAGGACTGTGLPPRAIDRVVGVVKAYTTRVGEGPFPTELRDDVGKLLGSEGAEFGATTGRPRRCGWFDAVVTRYACDISGFDSLAITKLDVLDKLPVLKVCVAYEADGRRHTTIPADVRVLERCRPVYEEHPGWLCPTRSATSVAALPAKARAYVERLCALTGAPLGLLSVGPGREHTLRVTI